MTSTATVVRAPSCDGDVDFHDLFMPMDVSYKLPDHAHLFYAGATAGLLMPSPVGAQAIMIPNKWAPYFMDFKTPLEALTAMEALIATLDLPARRDKY